jgi:hypothetical protein
MRLKNKFWDISQTVLTILITFQSLTDTIFLGNTAYVEYSEK